MKVKCENCGGDVNKIPSQIKRTKHHFCSTRCSNIMSNKNRWKDHVSAHRKLPCDRCGQPRDWRNTSGFCNGCLNQSLTEKSKSFTIGEIKQKHKSRINGRWYSAEIRMFAKGWNADLLKLPCQKCGYDKHIELCHINAINEAKDTTTLGEINNPANLVVLCPNHHWEFDNGVLLLQDIPPRKLVQGAGLEPATTGLEGPCSSI